MSANTSAVGVRRAFVPGQRITEQIAKQLDYESLQSFCSTEKQVYEFCQSDIGRIIMAEKYREFNNRGFKKLIEIFEHYAGPYSHPTKAFEILLDFKLLPFKNDTLFQIELEPDKFSAPNRVMIYRLFMTNGFSRNLLYETEKSLNLDDNGDPLNNTFFDDCQTIIKKTLVEYNETNKSEGYVRFDVNNVVLNIATLKFSCTRSVNPMNSSDFLYKNKHKKLIWDISFAEGNALPDHYDAAMLVPSQVWAEKELVPLLEKYLNLPVALGVLKAAYVNLHIETPPEERGNVAPLGSNVRKKLQVKDSDRMEVPHPRTGSPTYASPTYSDMSDSETQTQSTSQFTHSHSAWLDRL